MSALEKRFILRFLSASLVLLFAACVICFWIARNQLMRVTQIYGDEITMLYGDAVEIISPDKVDALSRRIVEDLSRKPTVKGVRFVNQTTGQKFENRSAVRFEDGRSLYFSRKFLIQRDTAKPPEEIRLELTLEDPSFRSVVRETYGQILLLLFISTVSVALGIATHRHLVVQPLTVFHKGIEKHKRDKKNVTWESSPPPDELGAAMRAYESLSRTRLEAEKSLLVSQERLRILSDNLPNAFLYQNRINPDGEVTFTFVGESVREMLGLAPEQIYRNHNLLREKIDPDYMAEMCEIEARAIRMRAQFSYECPYLFPDGKRHWVQLLSRPSQMPDGEYLWQGLFLDVTETRERDAELQRRRADALAILEALPDAVFVHAFPGRNKNVRFTHINQGACQFLGMTRTELLALGPGQVDELPPNEIQHIRTELEHHKRMRFETTFIRKDGRRFPGEICTCIIDFDGQTVAVSTARSLEEQKKREKQLSDAVKQIEVDRTVIAEKNTELNHLLHILCHDLANPISVLNGMLNAHKKNQNFDLSECSEISQQVLDLIGLVNKLQGFEASKHSIALERASVEALLDQAIRTALPQLKAKQLHVEKNLNPDLWIWVEPVSFLNSVLANILTNAIKFSLPGGAIRIRGLIENNEAILEIEDQGVGMPTDILDRIFIPTERTTRQGTGGEFGTGFGMPLVKKFMELYGGRIEIASTPINRDQPAQPPEHGTSIRLILPGAAPSSPITSQSP